MNFKKFNGTTWETVQHKTYDTLTESLERTANLADASAVTNNILLEDGKVNSNKNYRLTPYFENRSGLCINIDVLKPNAGQIRIGFYDQNQNFVERRMYTKNVLPIVIAPSDAAYIRVNWAVDSYATETIMINEGNTALPFIPYGFKLQASGEPLTDYTISGNTVQDGTPTPEAPVDVVGCGVQDETAQQYKLPMTVNGTDYPIYLGQVETTRKIKKLVLTGQETWGMSGNRVYITNFGVVNQSPLICTHFTNEQNTGMWNGNSWVFQVDISRLGMSGRGAWTTWLAEQYAAGTPVTVWYVLAEPETAVVNEPLMKIGDYADTISAAQAGVAIPTSDGDNAISFGTEVKPSAMSATFKGWHPVSAPKTYDGNDWS